MAHIHNPNLVKDGSDDEDQPEVHLDFGKLNIDPNPNQPPRLPNFLQPSGSNSPNSNHYDQPSGSNFNQQHRHSFGQRGARARNPRGGGDIWRGGSHSQRSGNHPQLGGNHSQGGGSYSQGGENHSPRGGNHSQRGGSQSQGGGNHSPRGGSHSQRSGDNFQHGVNSRGHPIRRTQSFRPSTNYSSQNESNNGGGNFSDQNRYSRDGKNGANGRENHESGIKMSEVRMPTGESIKITVPSSVCECKTRSKTKLIPLRREGKMGGREYAIVSKQMKQTIKSHGTCQFSKYNIIAVYKVDNCCLWKRYKNGQAEIAKDVAKEMKKSFVNQKMLFHGSNAIDDILAHGFDERRSKRDGYFGAGIYFAKDSSKSNQYVFGWNNGCPKHKKNDCVECVRRMLLCRVSLGMVAEKTTAEKLAHPPPGYNSVVGKPSLLGLKYHEYVVYRGEQVYPEYLIVYKIIK